MNIKERIKQRIVGFAEYLVNALSGPLGDICSKSALWAVRKELAVVREELFRDMSFCLSTARMHEKTFLPFLRIHEGRDFVIVASGPSAEKYKAPIPGAIHCAVNRSFQTPGIDFDYLFMQDISGAGAYVDAADAYRPGKCVKFYGLAGEENLDVNLVMSDDHCRKAGALRYRTEIRKWCGEDVHFAYDLATMPLGDFGSIVFPALQFALWTGAKRIYIVGCDNAKNGYAYGGNEKNELLLDNITRGHLRFREFVKRYYPGTEIISVNPVGLKGIYRDECR